MFRTKSVVRVGHTDKTKSLIATAAARRATTTAATNHGTTNSGRGNSMKRAINIGGYDITTPYIDEMSHDLKCGIYSDIYENDGIGGPAVDLMADLPFSDFKLKVSVKDTDAREKIAETFEETLQKLKMNANTGSIARESLVYGAHVSMLLYNSKENAFTDTLPFPYVNCEVQSNIMQSREPIINVTTPEYVKEFMASKSQTAKDTIASMPNDLVQLLKSGSLEMNPMSTIYLPRKSFTFKDDGMSIYRRIIPYYLIEKVLFRGTLTLANRRQSSIIHAQAGDDEWTPDQDELDRLSEQIIAANNDPIGAVLATNNAVNISEFAQGGDFWKWMDVADDMANRKMQALGINDAFLSGDANYNTAEAALSIFVDNLRAWRANVTRTLYYQKLFPLISAINNFTKDNYEEMDNDIITAATDRKRVRSDINVEDSSKYIIPEIEWEKPLTPTGDDSYMAVMEKLEEKGVPFGLRAWAAVGGYDFDNLVNQANIDVEDRKIIAKLKEQIGNIKVKSGGSGDDDDDDIELSNLVSMGRGSRLRRIGIENRNYRDRETEIDERTVTGKRKFVYQQERRNKELNEIAAKAIERMAITNGLRSERVYMPGHKASFDLGEGVRSEIRGGPKKRKRKA